MKPHIVVMADPVHVTPSHDCPQGSPPFAIQPVSWDGEFRLVNRTLRVETANGTLQQKNLVLNLANRESQTMPFITYSRNQCFQDKSKKKLKQKYWQFQLAHCNFYLKESDAVAIGTVFIYISQGCRPKHQEHLAKGKIRLKSRSTLLSPKPTNKKSRHLPLFGNVSSLFFSVKG